MNAREHSLIPMRHIGLGASASGGMRSLLVHEFGPLDATLKIHMQAGLHADEAPGSVVLYKLADRLAELQVQGKIQARISLLPAANPIGASQYLVGGLHCGRFDLVSGINFNRGFPDLRPAASEAMGSISSNNRHNPQFIAEHVRQYLLDHLIHWPCQSELDRWRVALMSLACTADWVLDLHCDQEAVMHMYTAPQLWPSFQQLAAQLGSQVQLLDSTAQESHGHGAFDTACFQPWLAIQEHLGQAPFVGCRAATIEMRGQADLSENLAEKDTAALLRWLSSLGAISGDGLPAQNSVTEPSPLSGVESIYASCAGVFVPDVALGQEVSRGQILGKLYDLQSHIAHPLYSQHGGIVFARTRSRAVIQGVELIKIAGANATRSGSLLSL
jgi:uncharacterized protein